MNIIRPSRFPESASVFRRRILLSQLCVLLLAICATGAVLYSRPPFASQAKQPSVYYPAPGDAWQRRKPEDAGLDSALLDQAVAYAKTQGSTIPADFSTPVEALGRVL